VRVMFVIPQRPKSPEMIFPVIPHLGVAYLSAVLKKNNFAVRIVDMRLPANDYNTLLAQIDQFEPDLIGITIYSYGYRIAYDLVDSTKAQRSCLIVLGGPHVSAVRSEVLIDTKADYAIKGEAEYSLLELCNHLANQNSDYEKIKGLIWRSKDGVEENEDRPYMNQKELDELPFPDYEEFELRSYSCFEDKYLQIITSRGCPYRCVFCSARLSMGRTFRPRSAGNVVQELEYWYAKGWRKFELNDDCFSVDFKRAKKICDLIIDKNLQIEYLCANGLRVDRIDRELLQKMKNSGCVFISFGVESGNEQVLRAIKKGITIKQVEEAVRIANEVGIPNAGTFIIGHPEEDFEKAMDTIQVAKSIPFGHVAFCNLVPYPGSELFDWVKRRKAFIYPPEVYLNQISYGEAEPIFETNDFTAKERIKALKRGFSLRYKTAAQEKLGKMLGFMVYLLLKNRFLREVLGALKESKTGKWILQHISKR